MSGAKQNLGCPVPQGQDLQTQKFQVLLGIGSKEQGSSGNIHAADGDQQDSYLVGVLLQRDGDGAAEAEVSDLERHGLAVHEQVVRLEVAVQHPAAVDEGHALAQLVHQDLGTRSTTTHRDQPRVTHSHKHLACSGLEEGGENARRHDGDLP